MSIDLYKCRIAVLLFSGVFLFGCTKIQPVPRDLHNAVTESSTEFSYKKYAEVLAAHVDDKGLVNYEYLLKNPIKLNQFYAQVAAISPDSHPSLFPSDFDKLAYWINAYNATVLKGVIVYYPIDSVEDVQAPAILFFFPSKSGFFFFQRFTYGGKETNLYYLENSVIRGRFKEPRIHFALNCASRSCPKLPKTPFTGDNLENQLDRETRKFINDPDRVRYDAATNTLYLSSIFKWYEDDFVEWLDKSKAEKKSSLLDYVLLYLSPKESQVIEEKRTSLKVEFLPYDWGLNKDTPN